MPANDVPAPSAASGGMRDVRPDHTPPIFPRKWPNAPERPVTAPRIRPSGTKASRMVATWARVAALPKPSMPRLIVARAGDERSSVVTIAWNTGLGMSVLFDRFADATGVL